MFVAQLQVVSALNEISTFPLSCLSLRDCSEHGRGYGIGVDDTDGNVASSWSASSGLKWMLLESHHVLNSVTCFQRPLQSKSTGAWWFVSIQ